MNCIIVDDEPLAREAVEQLLGEYPALKLCATFNNARTAAEYLSGHPVDLVFLDIQMPGITGLEFARSIPKTTLVIFTTAYTEYAADSYEVDAIDYLVKPIEPARFRKAAEKALSYHALLHAESGEKIETADGEYFFIKSDRRYFKVRYDDILFVEGLKDYVILQLPGQRIVPRITLKAIAGLLPPAHFLRVSKSYIVNTRHIDSFDNNDLFIGPYEIAIGSSYRDRFFEELGKGILKV